ncbi:hypothetical protein H0X06_06995 [Candidatus Dependentiae bacterium]|nr:hypothetical protein [Candidatus Dependentiae bacterium]
MTIFKTSLLLALLVGPCFGATAEFSPKHKSLLQSTAQATGSLVSTAFAAIVAYGIVIWVKEKGIQAYFDHTDKQKLTQHITCLGLTTCFCYLAYRLVKDARNSYKKAFYPKKHSKNTIPSENTSELKDSATEEVKNPQEEIVS